LQFKMRFKIGSRNPGNATAKNFCDHDSRVAGAVHTKICQLIRSDALRVKRAETRFIAEKRAPGHGQAAGKQHFDTGVEPDDGHARVAQKFRRARLRIGATTKREDRRLFLFDGAAERGTQLIGFELPERGFAMAFEKLWDRDAGTSFDALVKIHEAPAQLAGQTRANGAFAGAHEAGKADDRNARDRAARWKTLIHNGVEYGIDFIALDKEYSGSARS